MDEGTAYVRGVMLVASVENGVPTYYHYNAHGDVVQLTDGSGNVVKDYIYDAFGVELNATASDINLFRYCGEQYDTETGNYYLRARYYAPATGRFTQTDPIQDGLNWYAYCAGNPVVFADPSGLEWGALRDFVKDVEDFLLPPDPTHETYVFSGSGADDKVTVQLGDGYSRHIGTFYFDGRVEFPGHNGRSSRPRAGVAQNIDGHLYMERTDFYRAMGVSYVDVDVEFEVNDTEVYMESLIVGGIAACATEGVSGGLASFFISSSLTQLAMSSLRKEGWYKGHTIYAEICVPTIDTYISMRTSEEYMWKSRPDKPGYWELKSAPYTNYNGRNFKSVVDYLKHNPYERW